MGVGWGYSLVLHMYFGEPFYRISFYLSGGKKAFKGTRNEYHIENDWSTQFISKAKEHILQKIPNQLKHLNFFFKW